MGFDEALKLVEKGYKIRRKGWNGKGQFVTLGHMRSCVLEDGTVIEDPNHDDIGSKFLMFFGTSGHQCGWLASQADMLAKDWEVL